MSTFLTARGTNYDLLWLPTHDFTHILQKYRRNTSQILGLAQITVLGLSTLLKGAPFCRISRRIRHAYIRVLHGRVDSNPFSIDWSWLNLARWLWWRKTCLGFGGPDYQSTLEFIKCVANNIQSFLFQCTGCILMSSPNKMIVHIHMVMIYKVIIDIVSCRGLYRVKYWNYFAWSWSSSITH